MDSLRRLAARLDEAASTVSAVAYRVIATDPAHPAFGADAAGRPGELGRALHAQWRAATEARAREAAAVAARLATTADSVRSAADGYADADRPSRWRRLGEA